MRFRCVSLCKEEDAALLQSGVQIFERISERQVLLRYYTTLQEFWKTAPLPWDVAMVFWPGAEGMDVAEHVRRLHPETDLIWISNDSGFGVYSYRLQAKMFLCRPVTAADISETLLRCVQTNDNTYHRFQN